MVIRNYPHSSSKPVACHRCFSDKQLTKWIKENGTKGKCSWCGARNVFVVELNLLGDLFKPVVGLYHFSDTPDGDCLADLLQGDWEIFSDRIVDKNLAPDLVKAIMEAGVDHKELMTLGVDYRGLFNRRDPYDLTLEEMWEERAEDHAGYDPDESEGS